MERSPDFTWAKENPTLKTSTRIAGHLAAAGWLEPLRLVSPTGTILLWRCEGPVGAGLLRILHDRLDQRFASAKARWREYDGQLRQELPLIGLRYDKPKSGGK